jgi:hypothetical protein
MNKKNSDSLKQQSTATDIANNNNLRIKKQLKIEFFAESLLKGGLLGVTRWSVVGKQGSNNPGTFASSLRSIGIKISKGHTYILKDLASAEATVKFINTKRIIRNAKPLNADVIEHWLQPFIDIENKVAA